MLAFEVVSDGAGEQKVADERFRLSAMAVLVVMVLHSRIVENDSFEQSRASRVSLYSWSVDVLGFEDWRARNDA